MEDHENVVTVSATKEFQLKPDQEIIEIESGQAKVELIAHFSDVSKAIFMWLDNHNEPITKSLPEQLDEEDTGDFLKNIYYKENDDGTAETNSIETEKYNTFVNSTMTILTIRNPKFEDFGQYTLHVKYLKGHIGYSTVATFQLRIRGKLSSMHSLSK